MLQCQIWGRGTGNAGEWKALTQRKRKQVGCEPADHKKWGGACAALKLYLM